MEIKRMKERIGKSRTEKAIEYLMDNRGIDYVLETHSAPDFVECVCSIGGDVITFRVYEKNGNFVVAER